MNMDQEELKEYLVKVNRDYTFKIAGKRSTLILYYDEWKGKGHGNAVIGWIVIELFIDRFLTSTRFGTNKKHSIRFFIAEAEGLFPELFGNK